MGGEWDVTVAFFVAQTLLTGKAGTNKGGRRKTKDTRDKLADLEAKVARIAWELEDAFAEELEGVDVHCFRMTHKTWAKALRDSRQRT